MDFLRTRCFTALPLLKRPIHIGSYDPAKGPPAPPRPAQPRFRRGSGAESAGSDLFGVLSRIFNQIDLGLQRLNDSPRRNAVTPYVRAAALRSTALATSLALAVGLCALAADAWAKPKVPLPKPRPIARHVASNTAA